MRRWQGLLWSLKFIRQDYFNDWNIFLCGTDVRTSRGSLWEVLVPFYSSSPAVLKAYPLYTLCGNNLATHDLGWLCLSLLDCCVLTIVMDFLIMSGYLLIRSHVSFGGGVTGPILISAMRCGLDLCFAIERAWPLQGLAHPGRDHFSR